MDATSIGWQVAANLTGAFSAKIKRHAVANVFQIVLQIFENDAWLCGHYAVRFVESNNFIHFFHAENYLVEDGLRSAYKSSIATLRNDCNLIVITVFQDRCNFLSGLRRQEKFGLTCEFFCPITITWFNFLLVCDHGALCKYGLKMRYIRVA